MEKSFERSYSLNVARLKYGQHEERFVVDSDFFSHFEKSPITHADVQVILEIFRYDTHMDVIFKLRGKMELECDRCLEPYDYPFQSENRIVYSFSEKMDFEGHEVMYVDKLEPKLVVVQEIYDFIVLAMPLRRVPDPSIHLCDPEVLNVLGLDINGIPRVIKKEKEMDPRWDALKKLSEPPKEEE